MPPTNLENVCNQCIHFRRRSQRTHNVVDDDDDVWRGADNVIAPQCITKHSRQTSNKRLTNWNKLLIFTGYRFQREKDCDWVFFFFLFKSGRKCAKFWKFYEQKEILKLKKLFLYKLTGTI